MPRFVTYEEFGGPEVLRLTEAAKPEAGPGEIVVRARAAGLNPVDYKIFHGPAAAAYNAVPPTGVGNDFAGIVDAVGAGVTGFAPGDRVFGGVRNHGVGEYVVATRDQLLHTPVGLDDTLAAALDVAGKTAAASVALFDLGPDDTVLVSAAAGGVGVLAAQLALRTGATVIGTASPENHEFLRGLGVVPVDYSGDLVTALRSAAPGGITAVLDNNGRPTIEAALSLGIPASRINTIADHEAATEFGVSTVGRAQSNPAELAEVARLVAEGEIALPLEQTFPLEHFAAAYERLEQGHLRGKIVITIP